MINLLFFFEKGRLVEFLSWFYILLDWGLVIKWKFETFITVVNQKKEFKDITIFHQWLYNFNKIEENYTSVVVDDNTTTITSIINFLHFMSVVLLLTLLSNVFSWEKGHDLRVWESRIVLSRISCLSRKWEGKGGGNREVRKSFIKFRLWMFQRGKMAKTLGEETVNWTIF